MKKWVAWLTVCSLLVAGTAFAETVRIRSVGASRYVEGEVLVVLQGPDRTLAAQNASSFRSALTRQADALAASVEAKTVGTYAAVAAASGRNIVFLRSSTRTTEQLLADLKANPAVLGAQPNYGAKPFKTPNDPSYGQQWGLPKINAPTAWDTVTGPLAGADPVYVAVIDTGIDYNHPDLAGNMGRDKDNLYGKRFYDRGSVSTDPMDIDEHGSHVAGIIGAVGNNGTGVCGVNWAVKLLAVNVFSVTATGDVSAWDSDTIAAINYILDQKTRGLNVRVANMSLGSWRVPPTGADPYGSAIQAMSDAGILVAIAAGNEYQNIDNPGGPGSDLSDPTADYRGQRPYPACYRYAHTLTVGATDSYDGKSTFSNYSPNWVDLAAPGSLIYSTVPVSKGSYKNMSGTSMATPFVAGASALLMAAQPTRSTSEIRTMVLTTGNPVGMMYWNRGRLDVAHSLGVSVSVAPTPTGPPTTPTSGATPTGILPTSPPLTPSIPGPTVFPRWVTLQVTWDGKTPVANRPVRVEFEPCVGAGAGGGVLKTGITDAGGRFSFAFTLGDGPWVFRVGGPNYALPDVQTLWVSSKEGMNKGLFILRGGDANGDGVIDILDFSILAANFNRPGSYPDFNGDNMINMLDFSMLSNNYGSQIKPFSEGSVQSTGGGCSMVAPPGLLGVLAVFVLAFRHRRT